MANGQLDDLPGQYGPRVVKREGDALTYQRGENPAMTMIPMGDDTFCFDEIDWFRVRFERDGQGKVTRLVGLYDSGRRDVNERGG